MSTATSVISTSPRGPSFEGPAGRVAGGDSPGGGAAAVGFAGLLFSRLEGASGERAAPVRDGETLPAGGEGLPAAKGSAAVREGEAAEAAVDKDIEATVEANGPADEEALAEEEALSDRVGDLSELEKTEAETASAEPGTVETDPAELDKLAAAALEEATGEVAAPVGSESVEPETRGEGEGESERETAEGAKHREAPVDTGADEALARERGRVGDEPLAQSAEGAADEDDASANPEAIAQGRRSDAGEAVPAAPRGDGAAEPAAAASVAASGQPAGLGQAAAVAAESSALHTGTPGTERSAGESAAAVRNEPGASARSQAVDSGPSQGEGQRLDLAAQGGDSDAAGDEAHSRGEREAGRGGSEFFSQKDGAGKAEFVLPSAKELTFENPFRSLGLGVTESGSRSQGASGVPGPSLAQLQQTYQGSATGTTSLAVAERFGTPQWGGGVSQRIMWMANQQVGRAELRLDPPELGSLTVRLNITQDQASVSFVSPHAHVRDALEQQMPRLREMLAENGLNLQEADVSDQSASRDSGDSREEQARGNGRGGFADTEGESLVEAPRTASLALVDFYA